MNNLDSKSILEYYKFKRCMCFLDEWLWYLVLLYLLKMKYHRVIPIVLIYGGSAIYTCYCNLEEIEKSIIKTKQKFLIF